MRAEILVLNNVIHGLDVDEGTNELIISNLASSGNDGIRMLSEFIRMNCSIINGSKRKVEKDRNDKAGFGFSAKKFYLVKKRDQVLVCYNFDSESYDLYDTEMNILKSSFLKNLTFFSNSFYDLEEMDQFNDNSIYKIRSKKDIKNVYGAMSKLFLMTNGNDFDIEVVGHDKVHFGNLCEPPKPIVEIDKTPHWIERYKINYLADLERQLCVYPEKGRGKIIIDLSDEQFMDVLNKHNQGVDRNKLYDFKIARESKKLSILLDYRVCEQIEVDFE